MALLRLQIAPFAQVRAWGGRIAGHRPRGQWSKGVRVYLKETDVDFDSENGYLLGKYAVFAAIGCIIVCMPVPRFVFVLTMVVLN